MKKIFCLFMLLVTLLLVGCDNDKPLIEEEPFIKPITVKPIEIKENIVTETIIEENILHENVIH